VRLAALAAAMLAALVGLGCARQEDASVPDACTAGEDEVRRALEEAPGEVRLDGLRLSECLPTRADAIQVQEVGAVFVETGAHLAEEARADPAGPPALRLGYLVGAVRNAASRTQGIHDELRRRMEQELTLIDTRSPAFREGERAGRTSG